MKTVTILSPKIYCGGADRVPIEEREYRLINIDEEDGTDWACDQALVTFFSIQEILCF